MPRPARPLWVTRTYARRRHRYWMLSMTLASAGWGVWWIVLFLHRFAEIDPDVRVPGAISTVFAVLGLLVALVTIRAQRSWILFASIPVVANASLLFVPMLVGETFGAPG